MASKEGPTGLSIGKSIGKGAYGEVYEGTLDSKPVAVKMIHRCLVDAEKRNIKSNQPRLKSFRSECEILKAAQHPNVIRFIEIIDPDQDGSLQFVMERMSQTLGDFLSSHKGNLSREKQVDITLQVASGLRYLHLHKPQILHRDLTPKNILLDAEGRIAKIGDFGQAKFRPSHVEYLTSPCTGALLYMPPEVMKSTKKAHFTDKSDVFSLGVIMLEICTQESPSCGFGEIDSKPEVERREEDLAKVPDDHPLKPPIFQCLKNKWQNRPSIVELFHHSSPTLIMRFELYQNEKTLNVFEGSSLLDGKQLQSSELPDLPIAICNASAVVINMVIYAGGGDCSTIDEEQNVLMYSICSEQWTVLPPAPTRKSQLTCVDDELTLVGGFDATTGNPTSAVTTWDQREQKWISKLPSMPDARLRFAIVHFENCMLLMGGKGSSFIFYDTSTSILIYNKQSRQWSSPAFRLPRPMHSPSACLSSGYIFIAYSQSMYKIPVDDLERAVTQQMEGEWIKVQCNTFDRSAILRHSDSPLLVGGCVDQREASPNITLYDPATEEWPIVHKCTVPRALSCAFAISSSAFLVMGGCLSFNPHPCKDHLSKSMNLFYS